MSDLRTQLDAAMGAPPRSTVDIEGIVRRQRRAGRLRIAGAGGLTAVVLAGTVAGAVAVTGAGPAPAGPSAPAAAPPPATGTPGTTLTAPAAPRCPGGGVPAPGSLPPGAGPRLTTALQAAVRAEIGTRLYPFDDNGVDRAPLRFFGGPCDREERNRLEYLAVAVFGPRQTDPIMSVYVQTHEVTACSEGSDRDCAVSTGPGGEVIHSVTERGDLQGQRQVRTFVTITKPDGTILQLVVSAPGPPSTRPPLTVAQLTRIGLAPGLTLDL